MSHYRDTEATEALRALPQGAPTGARGVGPTAPRVEFRLQPGPQESFGASSADIVVYGGAAGGGKTYALLLDMLRDKDNPKFRGTIFRRTRPEITNEGGLWDESSSLYPLFGGVPNQQRLSWRFPSGAQVQFPQMQHEKDRLRWQGAQIAKIDFDELTHFTWKQFNYMLSRNRSTCGVKPSIRATCNPDPDHWLAKFISWWINPISKLPIAERSGVVRWFVMDKDEVIWADSKEELVEKNKKCKPKSFTFIAAKLEDNKKLMASDPDYIANLEALDPVQRARLLIGNWKVRYVAGMLFRRAWAQIVNALPAGIRFCRGWDLAATEPSASYPDPDWTRGVKIGMPQEKNEKKFFIADLFSTRSTPGKRDQMIKNVISQDGPQCLQVFFQDPGAAGKSQKFYTASQLAGAPMKFIPENKNKIAKATPLSAQMEVGNVLILFGKWNDEFLNELEQFPEGAHDDISDAAYAALVGLTQGTTFNVGAA